MENIIKVKKYVFVNGLLLFQLTFFLNKLDENIGFTAAHLFIIDRSVILSVSKYEYIYIYLLLPGSVFGQN